MIYSKILNKGEIIGITATSCGLKDDFDKERLRKAKENLKKIGFNTIETSNVFTNSKFVSSNEETRAKEFMNLLLDNNIKVIGQLRGGEFLLDMIPYLNDEVIINNPKWTFGYSDSSLLNFYITTKYQIATINSSNILQFAMNPLHESLFNIIKCFNEQVIVQESFKLFESERHKDELNYILDSKVEYKSLYSDDVTIKGRIIGGCLEAITEIIGTKYDYVENFCNKYDEGILWYLDIYDSNPLDLYRKLWQMKQANWFNNINGIIIGRTRSVKEIDDFTYLDSLHKIFDDMNIPVIIDTDIGHVMPQFSIINGSYATFTYKNGQGLLKQEKI